MWGHLPDTDAHIVFVGADGCDITLHLAAPFTQAAGRTHIAELAQSFWLHYVGLWK